MTILLEAVCDFSVKNENDQKIIHHVTLNEQRSILTLLKLKNVTFDLENKNRLNRTLLLCAVEKNHVLMIENLLDEDACIHAVNTDEFDLLHLTSYFEKTSVISTIFLFLNRLDS